MAVELFPADLVIESKWANDDAIGDPKRGLVFVHDRATAIMRVGDIVYFKNAFGWQYRSPRDRRRVVRSPSQVENEEVFDTLFALLTQKNAKS